MKKKINKVNEINGINEIYAVEGKFCSKCGSEATVEFDEDYDTNPETNTCSFVVLPYLWCEKCKTKLKTG